MAVTVAGYNFTQISNCDSDDGTWSGSPSQDTDNYKEGSASISEVFKGAGNNDWVQTPAASVDLSGTKHLRLWVILTQGSLINLAASGGIQIGLSDGSNEGWYYVGGRDTYPGGWWNIVLDVSRAVDAGTKPTAMNAITTITLRINLTGIGKNVDNTWVDNLCVCDGLEAYGDDGGSAFDLDNIQTWEDTPASGGIGIQTKFAGVFYSVGLYRIGDSGGTGGCDFNPTSSVLVFERRLAGTSNNIDSALLSISVNGNGTGTTKFQIGTKSGAAGISGCVIMCQDVSQSSKFSMDFDNANIHRINIYGATFLGTTTTALPAMLSGTSTDDRARSSNVATIGCTGHGLLVDDEVVITDLGGTGYNGTWTVATVPDANHFTYANTGDDESETADTGGTVTADNKKALNSTWESCGKVTVNTCKVEYCNFVSAIDDAITVSSATFNVKYCNIIAPTNHGVEITAVVEIDSTDNVFYGTDGASNYDLENTTAGAVIWNNLGTSNAQYYENTGGGSVTINTQKVLTLSGLQTGSEVRILDTDKNELDGIESSGTSFEYNYNYTPGVNIYIVVAHINYRYIWMQYALTDSNQTIPISQEYDRNYSNP